MVRKQFFATVASLLGAFLFVTSCSSSDSSSTEVNETELSSSSSDKLQGSSTSDSPTSSSSVEDSEMDPEAVHTITGFVNRGQLKVGSEVILRELDSTLAQTGTVYKAKIQDETGSYVMENVKLESPYVHLKVTGDFTSLCGGDEFQYSPISIEAYADVRKGDTINLNILTHLQAQKLPFYINKGIAFTDALNETQQDFAKLFLLDSIDSDFNKIDLINSNVNSPYLLGLTALFDIDHILLSPKPDLSTEAYDPKDLNIYWNNAYQIINGTYCFKFKESIQKFGYSPLSGKAKDYLKNLWESMAQLGECSTSNRLEIKSPAYNEKTHFYCESSKWIQPKQCMELDDIILDTLTPLKKGKIFQSPYCSENAYKYDGEWKFADNVDVGLGLACTNETLEFTGASGRKCYQCLFTSWVGMKWKEVDPSICEVYEHTCSEDGEVFKGTVDPSIAYVCDDGQARQVTTRDSLLDYVCITSSPKKSVAVGKTTFICNAGKWEVSFGDSLDNVLVDKRDGKVYQTIGVGNQRWMAQNLDYQDSVSTPILSESIYTGDGNDVYFLGTLYNWNAAMNSEGSWKDSKLEKPVQGICPEGYHIPSSAEWDTLTAFVNKFRESKNEAASLKAKSWDSWYPPDNKDLEGTNEFGTNIDASGFVGKDNKYVYANKQVYLWTSDADSSGFALQHLSITSSKMDREIHNYPRVKAAIRCVED